MKKTIHLTRGLVAIAAFATLLFSSCKKDDSAIASSDNSSPTETAATLEASQQDAEMETQYDDVFNITASMNSAQVGEDLGVGLNVSGLYDLGGKTDSTNRCFTITVVPNIPGVFPKTVTIDFGSGCLGRDGKYRSGKIVSIYTNRMMVPGAKVSTTFLDYHVDSFKIEGTHITENTSTSNMQGWKVTVLDGQVTNTATNRWVKWSSTKSILQVEGNGTPAFPMDDVYKITGSTRGSNSGGHTWTAVIGQPLIKKFACRWIVKGTVRIIIDGHEALLDYGNGDCDKLAIIYINGNPHVIIL